MLRVDKIAFRRMADITAGNLITYDRSSVSMLGLRVDHPPQDGIGSAFPAAGILRQPLPGDRFLPLIDRTALNARCLDWGAPPEVRLDPASIVTRRAQLTTPTAGFLIVVEDHVAIATYPTGGFGDRLFWDLRTGEYVDPGARDFCVVTGWALGSADGDGRFLPLLTYPNDYKG